MPITEPATTTQAAVTITTEPTPGTAQAQEAANTEATTSEPKPTETRAEGGETPPTNAPAKPTTAPSPTPKTTYPAEYRDPRNTKSPEEVSTASGEQRQPAIPEKKTLKYPNLGSKLSDMAARAEEGMTPAEAIAAEAPIHKEGSVAVTVHLFENVDGIIAFLTEQEADPRNSGEDYIEAYVPVILLGQLSKQPGVIRIREIIPPEPG